MFLRLFSRNDVQLMTIIILGLKGYTLVKETTWDLHMYDPYSYYIIPWRKELLNIYTLMI